jgi:predicted transcriptional regulator
MHSRDFSQREIARTLGISVSTVNKYVKQVDGRCSPRSYRLQSERTNKQDESEKEEQN